MLGWLLNLGFAGGGTPPSGDDRCRTIHKHLTQPRAAHVRVQQSGSRHKHMTQGRATEVYAQ